MAIKPGNPRIVASLALTHALCSLDAKLAPIIEEYLRISYTIRKRLLPQVRITLIAAGIKLKLSRCQLQLDAAVESAWMLFKLLVIRWLVSVCRDAVFWTWTFVLVISWCIGTDDTTAGL